jgi:hypothetical protein
MSKAGDILTLYCGRQTAGGLPASSRQATDFVVTQNGVLAQISNFTELGSPVGSAWDFYSFQVQDPMGAGARLYQIEPNSYSWPGDIITPNQWGGWLAANDEDSLASLLLMQAGVPGVLSAADVSLGDIVDQDSYLSPTLTLPSGKLSPFGITTLTGCTLVGKIDDQAGNPDVSMPTINVVNAAAFQIQIGWTTWPVGIAGLGTTPSKTWYVDIRVTSGSFVITAGRYSFRQVWKR